MKTVIGVLGFCVALQGSPAKAAGAYPLPQSLGLPQNCQYLAPHEDFGRVLIERYDATSIRVTGLYGMDPMVLDFAGVLPNGKFVFLKEHLRWPAPELDLWPQGGEDVLYSGTWGYAASCVAKGAIAHQRAAGRKN